MRIFDLDGPAETTSKGSSSRASAQAHELDLDTHPPMGAIRRDEERSAGYPGSGDHVMHQR